MNSKIKFLIYSLVMILLFNIKANSTINYGKYLKNYYNVPSYYSIEKECLKNSFYENIIRQDHVTNKKYEIYIPYKTKLDNIVIYS